LTLQDPPASTDLESSASPDEAPVAPSVDPSVAPPIAPADAAPAPTAEPTFDPAAERLPRFTIVGWLRDYFLGEDPTVGIAMVPLSLLSMLLYTRDPRTNFIFDEQEALLANPYVRSIADASPKFTWLDAFHRDFWGLAPDRTIGSYRPIPDLIWRLLWWLHARDTPFLHHWVNVLLHGLNGALVTLLVLRWTKRRGMAWIAGALFVGTAVITEAVSGVVGLADVLGGLGVLLALVALTLPLWAMPLGVFGAALLGLFSKESALCVVPLVPLAAVLTSQYSHPERPLRWARAAVAFVAAFAAFVLYVQLRRKWFPVTTPTELTAEANADKPLLQRTFAALLRWYAQPGLPHDPLNNPLIKATPPQRVEGALRVFWRGLTQVVFPMRLSGDYSSPQEPLPTRGDLPEISLGAYAAITPFLVAPVIGFLAWRRARRTGGKGALDLRPLVALGIVWIVISYMPVSNIPVLLPTVRAERFWYFPAIGSAIALAACFTWLFDYARAKNDARWMRGAVAFFALYLGWQAFAARRHANDYRDDLVFWKATREAVPRSAKAHLNYSVMLGARSDLEGRLAANEIAYKLAPDWPMASVYLGDTLCRLHRPEEAMPHYLEGFDKGANDVNLVSLGVQCLWDEKIMQDPKSPDVAKLKKLAAKWPGSWVAYIVNDTLTNGKEHNGVDPKYRPRGYNEGPKGD
jgi:hypothetical protein